MTHSTAFRRGAVALVACLALVAASEATAQSLFSTGGLGLVHDPQDARGHALGGTTLGLAGAELSWDNTAGAVGLPAAGLRVSFQLDQYDASFSGRSSAGSTARFPLIMGAFPFGSRWVVTAGFAGFLDQNWAFQQEDTLLIGGDSIPVLDRFTSEGGASRFRVGAGYALHPSLSVGLGAEVFTGGSERVAGRIFPGQVAPACCSASWSYSGTGLVGSVDWSPSDAVTLAVAGSAGGTLTAEATSGDDLVDRSYDLPIMLNVGATGRVAPSVLVTLGTQWSGWSSLDGALSEEGGARDSWSMQGGVELESFQLFGQPLPIRVGARREQLPFRFNGEGNEWAGETAFTGGTGLILAGGAARLDASAERGSRGSDAAGLEENYWRFLFSATVLGR